MLRPVPLMRPAEEEALRRYLAPAHLERARRLGVRAGDAAGIRELMSLPAIAGASTTPSTPYFTHNPPS